MKITPILYRHIGAFADNEDYCDDYDWWFCEDTLRKLFKLPRHVDKLWLSAYKKPDEDRVEFSLIGTPDEFRDGVVDIEGKQIGIAGCTFNVAHKLLGNKTWYLQLDYEE